MKHSAPKVVAREERRVRRSADARAKPSRRSPETLGVSLGPEARETFPKAIPTPVRVLVRLREKGFPAVRGTWHRRGTDVANRTCCVPWSRRLSVVPLAILLRPPSTEETPMRDPGH